MDITDLDDVPAVGGNREIFDPRILRLPLVALQVVVELQLFALGVADRTESRSRERADRRSG